MDSRCTVTVNICHFRRRAHPRDLPSLLAASPGDAQIRVFGLGHTCDIREREREKKKKERERERERK